MAKPHVLMLGWEYPPLIHGGLGVACQGLARALAERTRLTLVLPQNVPSPGIPQLSLPRPGEAARLTGTIRIPTGLTPYLDAPAPVSPSLYGPDLPAQVLDFAQRAAEAAAGGQFDLIHAHDWMTALAGLEIRARTGKPLVFHVHSLGYDRAGPGRRDWIHEVESTILREANLVVAVSGHTRRICIDHYGAPPGNTVVVHNGIAPLSFFRSPKPFPEKLVVFLGRLTGQKGPDRFLQIARRVLASNQKVRFAMAGTGPELRALMAGARRLGIDKAFHFTGFLERPGVHHLLSMADAYCMPSISEPFGLSALEATQFGLPVVLSCESGAAEILPEARTAAAADTEGLARHLLEILAKDDPKTIRPVRGWEDAATELMIHYEELTAAAPRKDH